MLRNIKNPPSARKGIDEAFRPQVDRPGLSRYQFATVAGVHEVDRRVRGVDTDMDTHFRQNLSFGVAGWRNG